MTTLYSVITIEYNNNFSDIKHKLNNYGDEVISEHYSDSEDYDDKDFKEDEDELDYYYYNNFDDHGNEFLFFIF